MSELRISVSIDEIDQLLAVERRILAILEQIHRPVKLVFSLPNTLEDITMLQITDIEVRTLHVSAVDKRGNPATLSAAPAWTVSDPTILGLAVATDGLTANITAVGPEGNCQVNVTDTEGGVTLAGSLDVTVVGSAAVAITISADPAAVAASA